MTSDLTEKYTQHYQKNNAGRYVYPTEFLVRAFLGNYPELSPYHKSKNNYCALDIGFGDCRNIPFLCHQEFKVFGVEIDEDIVKLGRDKLQRLEVNAELIVGFNHLLPFKDDFFNVIVACHSIYYLERNVTFKEVIQEVTRVLCKSNSRLVFSVPTSESYLVKNSIIEEDQVAKVTSDPLNIRNGHRIKFFDSEKSLRNYLQPYFSKISVGTCKNSWWGVDEHCWIAVCENN